jgi:hypothetical protein
MYRKNSMEFQSLQDKQNNSAFSKKNKTRARSARTGPTRCESGPDLPATRGRGKFEWPARGAPLSAVPGDRNGIGRARPSDLVTIDGRRSLSTRERAGAVETLGFRLGVAGAHRGVAGRWGRVGGGCEGSWWSRLGGGEVDAAPDDGAVEGSCRCSGSARQWRRAPLDLAKTKGMVRSARSRAFQRAWSREKRGRGDGNLYRAPERSSSKIELSPARESQGCRLRFGVVFLVS